ncbi:thermonuclease family protein [Persicobacter diffluens]|uniref:TNase-like domain-containing protein n=1 Tax=Persicobacter diffluens TaxID=981 RepID=A0AAN5AQJ8_9BACT|nr:hypothetical protein PEDI_54700 [Persicobacter diffluens]
MVKVLDGDTIIILDKDKKQHRIRFYGVDAPEKAQAFGQKSKKAVSNLIAGKEVMVIVVGQDKYERLIGKVHLESVYVNAWLVGEGLAWHYKRYAPEDQLLADLHEQAKSEKKGLWSFGVENNF